MPDTGACIGLVQQPPPNVSIEEVNGYIVRYGESVTTCRRCKGYKPELAHHCSTCKRCVRHMDHHCIWINNCVGERTQKFFILFLVYVAMASFYVLGLHGMRMYICFQHGLKMCGVEGKDSFGTFLAMVFSILLALIFGLFTTIMFADQMSALKEDAGYIERLKKAEIKTEKRSFWRRLCFVFGDQVTGFSIHWLLPTVPRFSHQEWYTDLYDHQGAVHNLYE